MMIQTPRWRLLLPVVFSLGLISCSGGGGGPSAPVAAREPLQITDLEATAGSPGTVTLDWTSPGFEDKSGSLLSFELRHIPLSDVDTPYEGWETAASPPGADPGEAVSHTVSGLTADQTYAFVLRARSGELAGPWSTVAVGTAADNHDISPPGEVVDLQWWSSTGTSLTVTWPPAGDDGAFGRAESYDVRYSLDAITSENWDTSTQSSGAVVPAAGIDRLQTTITGLDAGVTYHVAIRARDEQDLVSPVSANLQLVTENRRTWYVKVDGSGDAPTIEAALERIGPGDVVLVAPGRYTWTNQGTGDFYGLIFIPRFLSDFELRSEKGPQVTILDAEEEANVLWVFGDNENLIIDGFTITGGRLEGTQDDDQPYAGGGITVHLASPLIRNCIIKGNYADQGGGIWMGSTCEPRLENCIIEDNEARLGGGLMCINDGLRMEIVDCVIRNNTAHLTGGGYFNYNALFTMSGCVVTGNTSGNKGGGISLSTLHQDSWLINTTVIENTGVLGAGIRVVNNSVLNMEGCLVAMNRGTAFSTELAGGVAMGCSNVFGNRDGDDLPGLFTDNGGNFSLDPLICDPATGTLGADSPCLPGNHPDGADCGTIGGAGQGCR
jgi:hypothetical protein